MNKRLKYERYRGINNILTIDMYNGYTTIAIIGKNADGNYDVQLMLKENSINRWDVMEDAEHIILNTTEKTIYSAILKTVSDLFNNGFFEYYISRYKYELNCFDKGSEFFDDWDDTK